MLGVNDCQLLLRNAVHVLFPLTFWDENPWKNHMSWFDLDVSVFWVDGFSHFHPRKFGRDMFTQFEEHNLFQMRLKTPTRSPLMIRTMAHLFEILIGVCCNNNNFYNPL